MKKNFFLLFIILFWLVSLLLSIIWGHENPEKIEFFKSFYKKYKKPDSEIIQSNAKKIRANSFYVELTQKISLSGEKAATLSAMPRANNASTRVTTLEMRAMFSSFRPGFHICW